MRKVNTVLEGEKRTETIAILDWSVSASYDVMVRLIRDSLERNAMLEAMINEDS